MRSVVPIRIEWAIKVLSKTTSAQKFVEQDGKVHVTQKHLIDKIIKSAKFKHAFFLKLIDP